MLVAIFSERESHAAYFLQQQEMTRYDAVNFIAHGIAKKPGASEARPAKGADAESDDEKPPVKTGGEALEAYCVNLNEKARQGKVDPLIGRMNEVERCIQILCRRTKNNPLLVGDPGVGKTAIAEGLARKIVGKQVPEVLAKSTIFWPRHGRAAGRHPLPRRLRGARQAGDQGAGEPPERDPLHRRDPHGDRRRRTSGGAMDASNLLKPALASGNLRCMGSTTYKEFRQHFEKDRALVRRFQKIDVNEPTVEDTIKILKGLKTYYEEFHKLKYTAEALQGGGGAVGQVHHRPQAAGQGHRHHRRGRRRQMLLPEGQAQEDVIGIKEIETVVAKIARIPPKSVSKSDTEALKQLETDLKSAVFGQEEAIEQLSAAMKMARAGLRDGDKPIGCYLFSGPTGTGKTETARQLALTLGIELLRFDMSEYMERHTVSRLIGAPPGYVGFDQGGLLTDAVDQHPHAVVLLDEIEKAHQDVYNILLQVMDHGALTDANGKKVDFRNVVLIMTTNAGASDSQRNSIGFGRGKVEGEDEEAIKRLFTPEFRNRLDAIVGFKALTPEVIRMVVQKFVLQLEAQLADRHVTIETTDEAIDWLAKNGFDELYRRPAAGPGDPGGDQAAAGRRHPVRAPGQGRPRQGGAQGRQAGLRVRRQVAPPPLVGPTSTSTPRPDDRSDTAGGLAQ